MRVSFWAFFSTAIAAASAEARAAPTQKEFGEYGTISIELQAESNTTGDLASFTDLEQATWFNGARCSCGTSASVAVTVALSNPPASALDLEVWVGSNCDRADGDRSSDCGDRVASLELSSAKPSTTVNFPAAELIAPPNGVCTSNIDAASRTVWVVYREDSGAAATLSASISKIPADTKPPAALSSVELVGAENRLVATWKSDGLDLEKVTEIQALCAEYVASSTESADILAFSDNFDPQYLRSTDVCGDGGGDFFDYAPDYLCGTAEPSAGKLEISLSAIAPGTEVRVRLLAVDSFGNFTVVKPSPEFAHAVASDDFWEIYKQQGGDASGGCSAAGGQPSLWIFLGMIGLIFRRRRYVAALLAFGLWPAAAFAGDEAIKPKWGFGIEVGPYYPGIDREFSGADRGPFETVFGKSPGVMIQVRAERYYAWPLGQVGLGAGVGYMQRTANACVIDDDESTAPCSARSSVDETTFRLIPLSAYGVYRFSWLADKNILPISPYLKLGVAAQYWRSIGGDGETSSSDGSSGSGITFDMLGALGVVIRLDRVEPAAIHNLRQELGVSHVGLSAELSSTALPGLGNAASALRVGATTWSAGLFIEF